MYVTITIVYVSARVRECMQQAIVLRVSAGVYVRVTHRVLLCVPAGALECT